VPTVIGVEYTVQYRVKANVLPNFFTGANPVAGPEWTIPVALEFNCDGTQIDTTTYSTDSGIPLLDTLRYLIEYKVKDSGGGNHKIDLLEAGTANYITGDGSFNTSVILTEDSSKIWLIGDVDFIGTFYDVVVSYYDGAGYHSINIGTEVVLAPSTGSGLHEESFIAQTAETQLSLVGDENFVGTAFEVELRVASAVGAAIGFRALTSFQAPAGHSNFNRVGFIRTIGVLAGTAALNVKAVYDYNIETIVQPPPSVGTGGTNVWDSAVWDADLWDFSVEGKSFPVGTLGMGRTFAVGITGNANTRINVVGWDCLFQTGGYL
jgi:hypothetical protein